MKKRINPNIQVHLLQSTFYVLLLVIACARPFALAQRNVTKLGAPTELSHRTLTLEERVLYQRAIEEVYWRHRIWPKDRPYPKPSLDAVMSQAQLEKKVADYLRNSQALEDYWRRQVTVEQLQAEMNRMAQHTKQADVLRELFEVLGNDPFIVAECLARPALTERLVADFSPQDEAKRFERARTEELSSMSTAVTLASVAYALPKISEGVSACTDDSWTATSLPNVPDARDSHTAVWTGSEMIIWGGYNGSIGILNTGGSYNPATDSWLDTTVTDAPDPRRGHTAIWTGSEMIVWGGDDSSGGYLNTGGRYNPISDSWAATSITNAPSGRVYHTAVWTGSEMIIWGGVYCHFGCNYFNTGARYNPSTDSWIATSISHAPAGRVGQAAVWAGSDMVVWGGNDGVSYFNTGARYNPITDSWIATSISNAPSARDAQAAVWTGSEMIVWGGDALNTGGRYDPSADSWVATNTTNAPEARGGYTAVWADSEMIVWGGLAYPGPIYFNTGGRYNPTRDIWTATSTTGVPDARSAHTAVWTGSEMIVWGGGFYVEPQPFYLNTGGRYCAQSGPTPTPSPRPWPTSRPRPTPNPRPTSQRLTINQYKKAAQ